MDWFMVILGYSFISLCFTVSYYKRRDGDIVDLYLSVGLGLFWPICLGSRLIDKILGFDDQMSDLAMVILILLFGVVCFFLRMA